MSRITRALGIFGTSAILTAGAVLPAGASSVGYDFDGDAFKGSVSSFSLLHKGRLNDRLTVDEIFADVGGDDNRLFGSVTRYMKQKDWGRVLRRFVSHKPPQKGNDHGWGDNVSLYPIGFGGHHAPWFPSHGGHFGGHHNGHHHGGHHGGCVPPAVPLPGTHALLLSGFAVLSACARRGDKYENKCG